MVHTCEISSEGTLTYFIVSLLILSYLTILLSVPLLYLSLSP